MLTFCLAEYDVNVELYGIPKKDAEDRSEYLLNRLNLYHRRDDKVKGFSKA
jgi:ABC-type multidrug transport system ATPase subunit